VSTGAVVSTTVTVWLHCALFPQASVARQVRVATKVFPQRPAALVTVLTTATATLVPEHSSVAVGASNPHVVPHWAVLFGRHTSTGGVVSMTHTVWLH
jgi:hypothetical protein